VRNCCLFLFLFAASGFGQSFVRKTVCASGCDYPANANGLNLALTDAVGSQRTSCVPYIIEIDPSRAIDLNGASLILPAKTCAQYIRIRSRQLSLLPADGTRLDPSVHGQYMARLQSTTTNPGPPMVTIATSAKTRYWAFEGIDFYGNGSSAGGNAYIGLLFFGETGAVFPASVDRSLRPDHLEVKHCWLHGVPGARNVANGIGVAGNSVQIADSVVEDVAVDGGEAHAVVITYTDGPVQLANNLLDSATENTLVGGSFVPAGMLPSFLRFEGNKYSKKAYYKFTQSAVNPDWPCRQGNIHRNTVTNHDWTCGAISGVWDDSGGLSTFGPDLVKNVWEVKMGRGIRVVGNDFSGIWLPSAQNGEIFVMNLTTQNTTSNPAWVQPNTIAAQPWTTVTDAYVGANSIHDGIAFMTLGYPSNGGYVCALRPDTYPWCYTNAHNNILFYDNLAYNMSDQRDFDMGAVGGGDGAAAAGWFAAFNAGDFNLDFRHNTFLLSTTTPSSGQLSRMLAVGSLATGYNNFRDNIASIGHYGITGPYSGICAMLSSLAPGGTYDLSGNIITTDRPEWSGSSYPLAFGALPKPCATYNLFPVGTKSAASGAAIVDNTFHNRSGFHNTASDGRDSGADVDHVNWATAGAVTGVSNPALEYKLRGALTSASGAQRAATVYFTAPDLSACTWELSSDANAYTSSVPVQPQTRNGRDGTATWSGLSAATVYFARATCNGLRLEQGIDGRRFKFITAP